MVRLTVFGVLWPGTRTEQCNDGGHAVCDTGRCSDSGAVVRPRSETGAGPNSIECSRHSHSPTHAPGRSGADAAHDDTYTSTVQGGRPTASTERSVNSDEVKEGYARDACGGISATGCLSYDSDRRKSAGCAPSIRAAALPAPSAQQRITPEDAAVYLQLLYSGVGSQSRDSRLTSSGDGTSIPDTTSATGDGKWWVKAPKQLEARSAGAAVGVSLNLHKTRLRSLQLPDGVDGTALTELNLDSNKLPQLRRAELCMVPNLTKLEVSCNRLTELPLDFGVLLPLLTDLHIHDNLLTSLPDSIALLSNLRVLDAHNNQLSVLPDAITECHELRWVLLGGNVLTSLPSTIGDLRLLEMLSLRGNCLQELPRSFGELTCLRKVYLNNNPELCLGEVPAAVTVDRCGRDPMATAALVAAVGARAS
eukprot:m.102626 g.102626  ORF g.102626 m.102626 type:complete len:421 (+) comp20826_c0_seq1:66-1328(+)